MTHHVTDMEVISTLPDEVLTTQTKCSKHPSFLMDFFCSQHDVICCRSCMSEDHRSSLWMLISVWRWSFLLLSSCLYFPAYFVQLFSTLSGLVSCQCSKHPDFIMDFFCNQHHVICCRSCMSEEHRSCDQVMPLVSSKSEEVFAWLDAISSGMTWSHERCSSDMQLRQQITW
jgi:hypothetical protein